MIFMIRIDSAFSLCYNCSTKKLGKRFCRFLRRLYGKECTVQPTRYRILEILKEKSDVTVAELARLLDMAPVSVRHHLDVLQGENLIWTPRVRRGGTVGRPRQIYALTDAARDYFPNNHQTLALTMLEELKDVLPPAELDKMFQRMADKMAGEAEPVAGEAGMEERLDHAIDFLNGHGYLARWEKQEDVFLLYTLNCPYAGISEQHRELCRMDQRLIGQLLGETPQPVSRLSEGGCRCAYQLTQVQLATS